MSELDSEIHLKETNAAEFTKAKEELEQWKAKVGHAENAKDHLILKKLEEDQEKKKSNKRMMELIQRGEQVQQEARERGQAVQEQLKEVRRRKMELMEKLKRSRAQLQQKQEETRKLQSKFKICAELSDTEVEFVKPKQDEDDDVTSDKPIRGHFTICQEGALQLRGGQALITFEEEKVMSQILNSGRCKVTSDDISLEVTPKRIRTEPLVQFQMELCVSRSLLAVSEVVSSMPQQRVEERLELSLCRPSAGGAEVRSVDVSPRQRTATVAFSKPGVAEWFALRGEHTVDLDFQTVVRLAPVYEHRLHKFQSFCGAPTRTLLLDDIGDAGDDEEEVQDQLEIHFQKPSNGGGEIEHTLYTSAGLTALLTI